MISLVTGILVTFMKNEKRRIRFWVLPILAVIIFILTRVLSRFPEFTEHFYSQGLYPHLASIISFISRWFPFSLDDLFYLFLLLSFFILTIFLIIRKITFKKAGKIILNVISIVFIFFYMLWGFNYFRLDLNSRLEIQEQKANTTEFLEVVEKLVETTNKSYQSFEKFDKNTIDSLIEESYKNLAPALNLNYPSGTRRAKKISLSKFFAKAGISGYYGPFFNEVHVNSHVLPIEYPFVLAHEKAHQFGITSEAEANFYAWLVCTKSPSKQLQYSGNLMLLRYFINQGFRLEGYSEIINKLDVRVQEDFHKIREHWMGLRNDKVDKVATKVNDTYLKTNKVEKGIEDYQGVVKFVMDYSLDTIFQKRYGLSQD